MGFLNRTPANGLPRDIVPMMERFGRHEIDPLRSTDDGGAVFQATQQPLFPFAQANAAGFVRALADVCVPVGGWAIYGADRTVVNLVTDDTVADLSRPPAAGSDWARILDGSIAFLRANFVPPMRVVGYQWAHFVEQGGTSNTWLTLNPPPSRETARITPLGPGEIRSLIKMGPEPDANVVMIRLEGKEFVAEVDARWSDEDPTRSRSELARAETQFDLYLDLGYRIQIWDTADPEMVPFFPAPKALI